MGEQDIAAIVQICRRLDGIPLALELAAARVRLLTVVHIAERLDKRFDLLTTGSRTALPRQQTLRATIDWGYELLSDKEKTLFRHLSVFAGGFGLEAAERICADQHLDQSEVFPELSRLVDRSLIEVVHKGGQERYRMLETIHAYAVEKSYEAGEENHLRNRHLEYFTIWAEEAEPKMRGPEQISWWDRMEIEQDNIRAGLEWSLGRGDVQMGLRLASAVYWFWRSRGNWVEGLKWLKELLARVPGLPLTPARVKVLMMAGWLAWNVNAAEPMDDWCRESLEFWRKAGNNWWTAYVLVYFGWRFLYQSDAHSGQTTFEEAVGFARASDDEWILGLSLKGLGAAIERFDYSAARPILEESIAIWRNVGVKEGLADALNQLGTVAHGQKEDEHAVALYEESLRLYREMENKSEIAMVLFNLGSIVISQGNHKKALRLFLEGLTLAQESGDEHNFVNNLAGLGWVAGSLGKAKRAALLLGAAESWRTSVGENLSAWPYVIADYDRWEATARAQLDEETFAAVYAEGRAMTLEQALKYALEESRDG
jgi:tetratricopeptide (TPR) repeat protein